MEILFEIIFEVYFELMMLIVPEEKGTLLKYRLLSCLVALIVFVGCLALFGWGILVVDSGNKMGWLAVLAAEIGCCIMTVIFLMTQRKKYKY